MPRQHLHMALLLLLSLGGCELAGAGSEDGATDAGPSARDAGRTSPDGGLSGADAGTLPSDAGPIDEGSHDGGPSDGGSSGDGPVLKGRLTGVNWFGFETSNLAPHGLWARDYKSVLKQIKDLGFNAVRIPWCNDVLTGKPSSIQINAYGTDPYTKATGLNTDLEGLTAIQVMDKILAECERIDLKVILDNHSRAPDGYMNETIWYTTTRPEADWIRDWKFIAERYKNNSAVVAADVKNEPHGNMDKGMKPPATWGYDEPGQGTTDWRAAAVRAGQAILESNPRLFVIIEGVENYKGDNTWWGGNLAGVKDAPITESDIPSKNLWYSAHEYGPEVYNQDWFSAPNFPDNMPDIWRKHFWFIHEQNIAPLFFGEFGIHEATASDPNSTAYKWLKKFLDQMGKNSHWTFWALNPNSGDTGGLLKDDWVSVNPGKYALLKPYLASSD
jgi:endoglucanase